MYSIRKRGREAVLIATQTPGRKPYVSQVVGGYKAQQVEALAEHFGVPVVQSSRLRQRLSLVSIGVPLPLDVLELLLDALQVLKRHLTKRCSESL